MASYACHIRPEKTNLVIINGFGVFTFFVGVWLYLNLPDTMLKRSIDLKWYSIMIAEIGLFLLVVCWFLYGFEKKTKDTLSPVGRFFYRFGVA